LGDIPGDKVKITYWYAEGYQQEPIIGTFDSSILRVTVAIVNLEIHCALPKLRYGDQCRLFRYRALHCDCKNPPQFANQNKSQESHQRTENEGSRRNPLEEIFFSGSMTGKEDFHGWRASCRKP
jgi:hypothetical protein